MPGPSGTLELSFFLFEGMVVDAVFGVFWSCMHVSWNVRFGGMHREDVN